MRVPPNVKVSPTTAHLLTHFKDRREAKEMAMGAADATTHLIKLLELYATACRAYAGASDDGHELCEAATRLKEASRPLSPLATMLVAMGAELIILHHAHHDHGDPIKHGMLLDHGIEELTLLLREAQTVYQVSEADAYPAQRGPSFADFLAELLRGR